MRNLSRRELDQLSAFRHLPYSFVEGVIEGKRCSILTE